MSGSSANSNETAFAARAVFEHFYIIDSRGELLAKLFFKQLFQRYSRLLDSVWLNLVIGFAKGLGTPLLFHYGPLGRGGSKPPS